MTTLTEGVLPERADRFNTGNLLDDVTITDEYKDLAWSQLRRRGALDLVPMLGLDQ